MSAQSNNPFNRPNFSGASGATILQYVIIFILIAIGLFHQLWLAMDPEYRGLYIVLNPPGYLYPFVSTSFTWWALFVVIAVLLATSARVPLINPIPHRFFYPSFLYLLYLLIFVKPI